MLHANEISLEPSATVCEPLRLNAIDVTGTHSVEAEEVQRTLPAGAVANWLAKKMLLPCDVPWALRDDATSEFLDDDRPIGDQVETNASVTVTPKAHLG